MNQQGKTQPQSKRGKKKKKALAMEAEFRQGWNLGRGGVWGGWDLGRWGWVTFERGVGPRLRTHVAGKGLGSRA